MADTLTKMQAYAAMILFLERYSANTRQRGDVGALLSGMRFATDDSGFETFDPAYWHE